MKPKKSVCVIQCPQCGLKISELMSLCCPRCHAVLSRPSCHGNCAKCLSKKNKD